MSGPTPRGFIPRSFGPTRGKSSLLRRVIGGGPLVGCTLLLVLGFFSLPSILSMDLSQSEHQPPKPPFPVSVDPSRKLIVENDTVDELLDENSSLAASVGLAGDAFTWLAASVASLPTYKLLAGADANQYVVVRAGYRQEEVAAAFGSALGWTTKERQAFLAQVRSIPPTISEGEFVPGTYEVSAHSTPADIQHQLKDRFAYEILSRYSTTTAEQVPLDDALTIASLLEREAAGNDDIRLISGIIWNRLFAGMNLQIDATLQYAKAANTKSWWPPVVPNDKYIKSAYNTYAHKGLPPGPIANPSVAAVIAALNPKQTDCLFYFHNKKGEFFCSATYKEHVASLKKQYGQGK